MTTSRQQKKKPRGSGPSAPSAGDGRAASASIDGAAGSPGGEDDDGPRVARSEPSTVMVEMPILEHDRRPHIRFLSGRVTPRQAQALRLLFDGLVAAGEGVRFGRRDAAPDPVERQPDAIRWLLDRVADAAGLA